MYTAAGISTSPTVKRGGFTHFFHVFSFESLHTTWWIFKLLRWIWFQKCSSGIFKHTYLWKKFSLKPYLIFFIILWNIMGWLHEHSLENYKKWKDGFETHFFSQMCSEMLEYNFKTEFISIAQEFTKLFSLSKLKNEIKVFKVTPLWGSFFSIVRFYAPM